MSFYGPDEVFVPTEDHLVKAKIELANLAPEDVLYDLGCGDGKVLIHACQKFGCKGIGVDIDDNIIAIAKENITALGLEELIEIRKEDFLKTDLSIATVLILYLTRNSLGQLSQKLEEELMPGTNIITHSFDIPAWKHEQKIEVKAPDGSVESLFLYVKK